MDLFSLNFDAVLILYMVMFLILHIEIHSIKSTCQVHIKSHTYLSVLNSNYLFTMVICYTT